MADVLGRGYPEGISFFLFSSASDSSKTLDAAYRINRGDTRGEGRKLDETGVFSIRDASRIYPLPYP